MLHYKGGIYEKSKLDEKVVGKLPYRPDHWLKNKKKYPPCTCERPVTRMQNARPFFQKAASVNGASAIGGSKCRRGGGSGARHARGGGHDDRLPFMLRRGSRLVGLPTEKAGI